MKKKQKTEKITVDNHTPRHIGIIMDGNRRWARERGFSVRKGHEAGAENLQKIVDHCEEVGVKTLTVYALSTENWKERAAREVKDLFDLLLRIAQEKREEYAKRGIKVGVVGDFQAFPRKVARAIGEVVNIVKQNERMKVNLALNYGGRAEIIKAVQEIIKEGIPAKEVNEKLIAKHLYTNGEGDPDLIIRTGGEIRLSNFLLWQSSYSELYFTNTLWPDFGPKQLDLALKEYRRRERRFGK